MRRRQQEAACVHCETKCDGAYGMAEHRAPRVLPERRLATVQSKAGRLSNLLTSPASV